MDYAEASYFDGYHFQHVAAWYEHQRLNYKQRECRWALERWRRER